MSTNLRGKYAIVGVGQSPLGKVPDLGPIGLFSVAAKNAIEDAGLKKEDVDGLITGNTYYVITTGDTHLIKLAADANHVGVIRQGGMKT